MEKVIYILIGWFLGFLKMYLTERAHKIWQIISFKNGVTVELKALFPRFIGTH